MTEMNVDVETFSKADLKKVGLYRYCADPSFEILWIAFALDGGPVTRIDMSDPNYEHLDTFARHLMDPWVIKRAFNAAFERAALAAHYGRPMDPRSWRCTMVQAAVNGLPMSLDAAARVLGGQEKDAAGKALMNLFSKPQKPTKKNGQRTRILPEDEPDKWIRYGDYCGTDVEAERQVSTRLAKMNPISDFEQALWTLDQEINDRGILVDLDLAANAIQMDEIHRIRSLDEAAELTGLANPGSALQMKGWLVKAGLWEMKQLTKETIKEALDEDLDPEIRRALELRLLLAKTSVTKYQAILNSAGSDNRIRGAHQFYGARTGRWAGRILQTQNLPQNHIEALDVARETVLEGDLETLELLFDSVPDTLSQLIRTAIIAPPGKLLVSVDFSQIEARVIAWLSGEKWRMDIFHAQGKIYEESASRMFSVPLDRVDKKLRAKGKIAELALGYQGSTGSLISMGALTMGLEPRELQPLVDAWRYANPKIVQLWEDLEDSVIEALLDGHSKLGPLRFIHLKGTLYIQLPSGRRLAYASARVERWQGRQTVGFMAWIQGKWQKDRLYGGRIAENVVQAIARDILAEKMLILDKTGFRIISTIHDEILMEGEPGDLAKALKVMAWPVAWAPGLPLTADGFESPYFKK